jgi:hypothetical protein
MARLIGERIDTVRTTDTPESLFTPEAVKALVEWSAGNPRQLLRVARVALEAAAEQGRKAVPVEVARHVTRTLTVNDANEARAEVAAAAGQPVQTQMPLLEATDRGSSSATTQPALSDEEGSA